MEEEVITIENNLEEEKNIKQEEELTTAASYEDIMKQIEEGNSDVEDAKKDYAAELNELVKNSLTEKDYENFTVPELSDEEFKTINASEDDIKLYKTARILENDKEDKLDVESYVSKEVLDIIFKELDITTVKNTKEDRNKAIKAFILFKAYEMYIELENNNFADKLKEISTDVNVDEILKAWFKSNNDLFGIGEDLEFLEETEDNKFSIGRDAYKRSLTLEDLIEKAKSITLKKLIKECSDKRYKRHIDRFNLLIRHHLRYESYSDKDSKTTNCENVPLYTSLIIGMLIKLYPEDKETFEQIIKLDNEDRRFSRSIVVLTSLVSNTLDLGSGDVVEPYFINMNLYMISNIPTLSDTSNKCTRRIADAIYEIMKIILKKGE